ncbi:MAG: nitrite reductase small subunit NirD [Rhodobacteraceae bacterium]|nr:nitrite reductase small subunit NirD [Paracoccaceae bacterium]
MTWVDIGALEDIPRRGARVLRTPQGCVAVFRTEDDRVFALDDRCPHRGGPLSEGIVHGDAVTCPLHGLVIGLTDGQAREAEAGGVATHPARIEGGRILIDASRLLPEQAA